MIAIKRIISHRDHRGHRDLKKIIKHFFSAFSVSSVREIIPATSQVYSFKIGLNHWILSKYIKRGNH